MQFLRYPHVENTGRDEVEGIEVGTTYVFPKLDGSNASVWRDHHNGSIIQCSSRNRILENLGDLQGFYDYVQGRMPLHAFLAKFPFYRLYGEWLCKHTLKTYRNDAWKEFYIFDVYCDSSKTFLSYESYKPLLEEFGLEYVPCIKEIKNGSTEQFIDIVTKGNTYLIKDGEGVGEGIVIKNYCVTPDMRILTHDLQWKPAGDIKLGEELIGLTEERTELLRGRHFCSSKVLQLTEDTEEVFELTLSDGTILKSTAEHPWLVIRHNTVYVWRRTDQLFVGSRIRRVLPTWKTDKSYEAGWLAGFYDGEGTLVHDYPSMPNPHIQVSFSQKEGKVLDRALRYLVQLGYSCHKIGAGNSNAQKHILIGGKKEALHFLGSIRPIRGLKKLNPDALGGFKTRDNTALTIDAIRSLGKKPIIRLGTSSHTYFVEGFGSHNSYRNKYGRQCFAKLKTNDFLADHHKKMGHPVTEQHPVEAEIVEKLLSVDTINKVLINICHGETGMFRSQDIPQLLETIWHDFIVEETYQMCKKFKNPTINFKKLKAHVIAAIKETVPEAFGGISLNEGY